VGDKVSAEPVIWAYERGKGRVVASTLGHFDWTFDDPYFRTILLRGIAWAAGESPYRFDPLILRGIPLKD
jgi:type 1 glutamine amidotransferase